MNFLLTAPIAEDSVFPHSMMSTPSVKWNVHITRSKHDSTYSALRFCWLTSPSYVWTTEDVYDMWFDGWAYTY